MSLQYAIEEKLWWLVVVDHF